MSTIRGIGRSDVAVLLISAAALMGSLSAIGPAGRRRAREVVCQYNLRQWGDIFQGYLQRNDGEFFTGDSPAGYWWVNELDNEHKDWKQTKIWLCPEADKPSIDENGNRSDISAIFAAWGIYRGADSGPNGLAGSYGLNGYAVDIPMSGSYEGGVRGSDGWRNFDTVPNADKVPLFIDALRFDLWPLHSDPPAANEFAAWGANSMARCCINRHSGAVNCLSADWSVRKVALKELWTLKWHKSFNTAGPWTRAGGVTATDWPEWMRDFEDY
jgi:hypothetical protein